jgi:predicted dehydrogenase
MSENKDQPYTLRWGVIGSSLQRGVVNCISIFLTALSTGTGLIASWFVSDLVLDPSTHRKEHDIVHRVTAIGSSSIAKGTAFAEKHISASKNATPKVNDNYEAVYNDPEVDIVYIATPHALHAKNALDAIHAGKHVLCEKPMTMNAREAEKVIAAAQEKGVFLMEGQSSTRRLPYPAVEVNGGLIQYHSCLDAFLSLVPTITISPAHIPHYRADNSPHGRFWTRYAA